MQTPSRAAGPLLPPPGFPPTAGASPLLIRSFRRLPVFAESVLWARCRVSKSDAGAGFSQMCVLGGVGQTGGPLGLSGPWLPPVHSDA